VKASVLGSILFVFFWASLKAQHLPLPPATNALATKVVINTEESRVEPAQGNVTIAFVDVETDWSGVMATR
jgi:hypothetical protein